VSDDGRRPWPPRERWTAYELGAEWDGADDPTAFLASLSEAEWTLIVAAAAGLPDAAGYWPSELDQKIAGEMLAAVSVTTWRPN
jgi:hypothetical protein